MSVYRRPLRPIRDRPLGVPEAASAALNQLAARSGEELGTDAGMKPGTEPISSSEDSAASLFVSPSDAAYVRQIDRINDDVLEAAEKICRLTGAVLTDHEISESIKGKHELVLRFDGSLSAISQLVHKLRS